MFSSASSEWGTPRDFFARLNAEFRFELDAAATHHNALCEFYFVKNGRAHPDAMHVSWAEVSKRIFCNPPYGRNVGRWFEKAREAQANGATVVMLVPARTDVRWWHKHVERVASEVRFVKGRLRFVGGKYTAPFPSAVIIYRPE